MIPKPNPLRDCKDLPGEEWRWVPGYEGRYEVSGLGRVRSYVKRITHRPDQPLELSSTPVRLLKGRGVALGLRNTYSRNALVAYAFHGVVPETQTDRNIPLPGEEWRSVAGYPEYSVSSAGRLSRHGRVSSAKGTPRRYMEVHLPGSSGSVTVQDLVLTAFIGPRPSLRHVACHLNDIKNDNRIENLRWGTRTDNARDYSVNARRVIGKASIRITRDVVNDLVGHYERTFPVPDPSGTPKTPPPTAEEWKWVEGFEGRYDVSSWGRVRSYFGKGRTVSDSPVRFLRFGHTCGYPCVPIRSRNSKARSRQVHRLVAEAFLGPCPDGQEVRHLDGDRANNCLTNLAYGTRRENVADMALHGTRRRGASHGVAKLNDAQVLAIRRLHLDGVPQMDLCRAFGVTSGNVHNIVAGKLWRHLPLIPPATRGAP